MLTYLNELPAVETMSVKSGSVEGAAKTYLGEKVVSEKLYLSAILALCYSKSVT